MMAVRSFFVLFLATRGASHNIYTENSSTLTGNSSSQFGYSVAFWETNNKMKLVVAAPMEDNGLGGDGKPDYGLIIPGEVYLFDPHNEFTICCQGDTKLEPLYDPGSDKKDLRTYGKGGYYFGLGSTVVTGSSANAPLLMCAPRSSYYKQRGGDRTVIPEGECLLLYGNSHKPLRLKPKTNNVRYCGFSAAFDKNDTVLYLGCPSRTDDNPGYLLKYDLTSMDLDPLERNLTKECGSEEPYDGWGMTQKDFRDGVLTSCRESGEVVELETSHQILKEGIGGIGEMKGAVLTVCDVDGDGVGEVLVGAPLGRVAAGGGYNETGKVFVVGVKGLNITLKGEKDFSRFGTSVACLGDLDLDGYQDVAVGAPQHPGGGAVFVYLGSPAGLNSEPSQVILQPRQVVGESQMSLFGYSVAGGKDVDKNGYPDLLVGAPLSNTAHFFRTAPVLRLRVSVFEFRNNPVDLRARTCNKEGVEEDRRVCFFLCVTLQVQDAPHGLDLELDVKVELDVGQSRKRIFFKEDRNTTNTIRMINETHNITYEVYAEDLATEEEFLAISEAELYVTVLQIHSWGSQDLLPVFRKESPTPYDLSSTTSVKFTCGDDVSSCVAKTNLRLSLDKKEITFIIGETTVLVNATLSVENNTAFEPVLRVGEVFGMTLQECRVLDSTASLTCMSNGTCVTSPKRFSPGEQFHLAVVLQPQIEVLLNASQSTENFTIKGDLSMRVFNEDFNESDNLPSYTLLPRVVPSLNLYGESQPESLTVNGSNSTPMAKNVTSHHFFPHEYSPEKMGEIINHTYVLTNRGLTQLIHTQINISWPVRNRTDGKQFSLLQDLPVLEVPLGTSYQCYNVTQDQDYESGMSMESPVGSGNESGGRGEEQIVSCRNFECWTYRCELMNLPSEGQVKIYLLAVILTANLQDTHGLLKVQSSCGIQVVSPRKNLAYLDDKNQLVQEVKVATQLVLLREMATDGPPAWVIIMSILGGLLLVGVVIAVLYKLGFFKRKRLPSQPLGEDNATHQQ